MFQPTLEQIEATSALHRENILHGGIQPENILIANDGHILLTGFERSIFMEPSRAGARRLEPVESAGSPTILQAPEVILGWGCDRKADLWGFGLVLCYMLSGMVRSLIFPSYPI